MLFSKYYGMNLPEGPDRYNVEDFNANVELIDAHLYPLETDFRNHAANTNNPHLVTKAQVGLSQVENKTSAMIRNELTSTNVTNALGYTPLKEITSTSIATALGYSPLGPGSMTPNNVASTGSVGSSNMGARQDHTHGISVTTGDSNGQIKVAGINASVKGLGDLAFKNRSSLGLGNIAYKNTNGSLTEFLRGDGTWANPAASTGGSLFYYQTTEPTNALVNTVWVG